MYLLARDVQGVECDAAIDGCGEGRAKGSYRWTKSGEGWTQVALDRGTRGVQAESSTVHLVHGRVRVYGRDE